MLTLFAKIYLREIVNSKTIDQKQKNVHNFNFNLLITESHTQSILSVNVLVSKLNKEENNTTPQKVVKSYDLKIHMQCIASSTALLDGKANCDLFLFDDANLIMIVAIENDKYKKGRTSVRS